METIQSVERLVRHFDDRKDFYVRWHAVITFFTIGLSLMVTISGVLQDGSKIPACLGAAMTALLIIERSFALGGKSDFYKVISAEAKNLLWDWQEDDSE